MNMSGADWYLVCFLLGLAITALSFVSGIGHLHLGHLHLGHGHSLHSKAPAVNVFTVAAFLCWFGGTGYLLTQRHQMAAYVVLALAVVLGTLAAALVFWFFAKVLLPRERELRPEDTEMRGVVARVSMPVRAGSTGEILFSLNGTRRSAAARAATAIDKGAEVLVTRYERGIAWVEPFDQQLPPP